VGDSRAREVVLNSLRQPGVDFVLGSRAPEKHISFGRP
jgi:hypothetical protein